MSASLKVRSRVYSWPELASLASLTVLAFGHSSSAQGAPLVERDADAARIEEVDAPVPIVLEGFVLAPDGTPAEGAVVVSSAGGQAITDQDGHYRLSVGAPIAAQSVQVTAAGSGSKSLLATTNVALSPALGPVYVAPLALAPATTCQPSWLPTFGRQPGFFGPA